MNQFEKLVKQWHDFMDDDTLAAIQETIFTAQRVMSYYKCALLEVETKFRVLDEEFSMRHERNPIDNIRTRIKSTESIVEKLQRKGYPMTLDSITENLNDVAGIRVICPFIDDIYLLADCLERQDDIQILKRVDYIRQPKPNGYRSLHLVVAVPIFLESEKRLMKVEIQLRTIAMDSWANLEHRLRYKKDLSPEIKASMAELLRECASMSSALDEKMQQARRMVEEDEISSF